MSMMFSFIPKKPIWLIVASLLSGCSDVGETDTLDRVADEREIRSLVMENAAASNAGNPAGVAATYTPDGDAWIAGLSRFSTHEGLRDMEGDWIAMPGYQRWEGKVEGIRFISRDAAIVEISATTFLDTGNFDEETTLVVTRTDTGWKISAWRVMTVDPEIVSLLKG